jgi:hypothetical protein
MAHPMSHVPDALIISLYYINKIVIRQKRLFCLFGVCVSVCVCGLERDRLG